MALDAGRSSLDTPFLAKSLIAKSFFGTTTERREKILNHGLHELTRMGREDQGYAWASQAGAVFSNPFTSELERDYETPSPILLRKWPCACASLRDFLEKTRGCDWPPSGDVLWKKHPQARLRVSFPQHIHHSHSESTP